MRGTLSVAMDGALPVCYAGLRDHRKIRNSVSEIREVRPVDFAAAIAATIAESPLGKDAWADKTYPFRAYLGRVTGMNVLKRKDFARWQASEKLPDAALCKAVHEMEAGLVDADLGGFLYKKRVARPGGGKSGGYRTLLSARIGSRYVFLHGFPKSDKANITQDERKALQFAGKLFLELSAEDMVKALEIGVLLEVCCDEQAH